MNNKTVTTHTIEEAFQKFKLGESWRMNHEATASATSMLAWINGETSDTPKSAHALLVRAVTEANDAPYATSQSRHELVELGMLGVLDTWWMPDEVIVRALTEHDTRSTLRWIIRWRHTKSFVDLKDVNLRYMNLTGVDLHGVDLTDSNLQGTDLTDANLHGANLTDTCLYGANLCRTDLCRANLTNSNITEAYLYGANLYNANLTGVDITNVNFLGANLKKIKRNERITT